jgi:hypothetical protein
MAGDPLAAPFDRQPCLEVRQLVGVPSALDREQAEVSRLKNQIPGFSSAVTYVRTLSSGKLERRGSGKVPRSRKAVIMKGVTPSQALPSC